MLIQPKFQIGRQARQYVARKEFTNREIPREVFLNRVKKIKSRLTPEQAYDVMMYYGVGGIGKSSLQKQMKKELTKEEPNALYTSLDFKDTAFHSPARALLELVREVKCKKKIIFPHFEVAYSIYFYKRNPDMVFNKKSLPFGEEFEIIGNIISTFDGFGIAQTVTGIVGKIYDTKKQWSLNQDAKGQLKELENLTVQEVEEHLIAFFAFDLQQAIEKHRIPVTVIFLDTFEALWSDLSNKTIIHTKDKWIRDLIVYLPNVLFVLCGRESLEWEHYDPAWKHILEHHLIENLARKDAEVFLINCGLEEEIIREKMIQSSGGYPYHLDLSVDTYFEMKNRGEVIESSRFGSNQREILDRFLQYLSDYEIETLKIMSIARFYNRDIFTYLLTEHPTGYPVTKFDDFNKFSFITEEHGKLFINALMRQGILNYSSADLVKTIHETMAAYYENKFTAYATTPVLQGKKLQTFTEWIFHKKAYLDQDAFVDWLSTACLSTLKELQLRGETSFLRQVLGEIYTVLGAKGLGISLMQILIDMVHLNGEYADAIAMIDEYFAGMDIKQILATKQGAQLAIRKVHHQMFTMPVRPLIQELLAYESDLSEKNWPAEYNELLFMIGGNLGVLSGDMKLSREWLVKSIRYSKENDLNSHLCRALRKYADVLKIYGHLSWARKCCETGIEIARTNGYERYEAILVCTLADIYRMENKHDIAKELLEEAMKMIKKVGIKGWEGHIHGSYAEMYYEQGSYQAAANKWVEALESYAKLGQSWGLIVSNIGLERCRLKGVAIQTEEPIAYWIAKAGQLNYQREWGIGQKTASGEIVNMPLAFL